MAKHYCVEHQTVWFKKGAMRGYAHPIEDENGKPTGKWCNEPEEKESVPQQGESVGESKPVMSKDDWSEKDRITRKSIERQTSLNAAVEVSKTLPTDQVTTGKIIATAKLFEAYLEGRETKRNLVEEAKKLGAVEIELEDK